ncbi:MAG: hypothetical protein GXO16_07730 [Epsilonproteobacteria bacterium]|nr:hypothetical protein [Campylobacterota bacterium]
MVQNLAGLLRGKDVFVEGVGFLGRTGDIELPKVKFKQTEVNGRNHDTGLLEPLEAQLEILEFNPVIWQAVQKRINELATFVIKASVISNSKETAIYCEIGGWVSQDEGAFNNVGDKAGIKLTIDVQTYTLEIDGAQAYKIDIPNYICTIGGADKYATLRSHIQ